MGTRKYLWRFGLGLIALTALYAFQPPFREYPGLEYNNFPLPADYREQTEWVFARLMYPQSPRSYGQGFGVGGRGDWRGGSSKRRQGYPHGVLNFAVAVLQ